MSNLKKRDEFINPLNSAVNNKSTEILNNKQIAMTDSITRKTTDSKPLDNLEDSSPNTPDTDSTVLTQKRLAKIKEDFFNTVTLDSACGSSRNSSLSSTKNDYIIEQQAENKNFPHLLRISIDENIYSSKQQQKTSPSSNSLSGSSIPLTPGKILCVSKSPIESTNPTISCLRNNNKNNQNIKKLQNNNISFASSPTSSLKSPTTTMTTLTDRFVQQHHGGSRGRQQHRCLKKYASEIGFGASVLKNANAAAASTIKTERRINCYSASQPNSDDTSSPPVSRGQIEPMLSKYPFHPTSFLEPSINLDSFDCGEKFKSIPSSGRPSSKKYFNVTNVPNGGGTIINKLNRRRQDSDDASGSLGSETTVASGQMTPQSRRNQRFKMRRPKSTGNMGISSNTVNNNNNNIFNYYQSGQQIYCCQFSGRSANETDSLNINNNIDTSNIINYDPSFTSATIHSLDDSIQQPLHPGELSNEERRHSNFYLFEDDSNHEFDKVNGKIFTTK